MGGNTNDNFVYHREADSFPLPMRRQREAANQKPPNAVAAQWGKFRRRLLPGGNNGVVGSLFGFGLPVVGTAIVAAFIYSSTSDANKQYAQVQQAMELQNAM